MKRIKGFTIIESLIATSLAVAVTLGSVSAINSYSEREDLEKRSLSTSSQMIEFAEASYKLTSSIGGLENNIINLSMLKEKEFIDNSFPEHTPYGQTIKGFLVDNPSDTNKSDLLITTIGDIEPEFANRSGQSVETVNRIQEEIYLDLRRNTLSLGRMEEHNYFYGKVENGVFSSAGNLHVRDVSGFTNEINSSHLQPAILLTSPNQQVSLVEQIQAIDITPFKNIPANGIAKANITIAVRYNDGTPVRNSTIYWNTSGGTLSSSTSTTNEKGLTNVTLKSNTHGTKTITARLASNGVSKSGNIIFVPPNITSLSASPTSNLNADGIMCSNITANLAYPDGTVAINESVNWITNLGTYKTKQVKTNSVGKVNSCLVSSTEGNANARAQAVRSGSLKSQSIQFIGPRINNGAMWASPSSAIPADGSDYSRITVRATYPNGKRASGVAIKWSTNRGWLNATQTITNANGETSVVIRSNQAGNATVVARVPTGQSKSVTVGFDAARLVNIYANKTSDIPSDGSSTSTISAVLQYPNGKRAVNEIVQWSKTLGDLSYSSTRTNSSGIASNYLKSNNEGTSVVTAHYGGTSKSISISFKSLKEYAPSGSYGESKYNVGGTCPSPRVSTEAVVYWGSSRIYRGPSKRSSFTFIKDGYQYVVTDGKSGSTSSYGTKYCSRSGETVSFSYIKFTTIYRIKI